MKWFWAFVVLLLLFAGWWYFGMQAAPATGNTGTPTTTADIIAGVPNKTYTNSHLSFTMQYPATASSSEVDFEGFLPRTQTPVVSFTLPRDMFAGTNLVEAGVYIGATTTPTAMQICENAIHNGGETPVATTTIGGQEFTAFTATGAGAGNLYESKIFRTYQNGACFEIVEMLHSGNIGNYTPGTVTQFDKAKYLGILDSIVSTYTSVPTGI